MKLNKSTVALAVCAAIGSTAAMADYASAAKVYIGGATATDNTLEDGLLSLVGGLCNPSQTIDIWRAANQRVIRCTTVAATPNASNVEVAVHKESNGGSSNGVVPITQGTAHTLVWLNPSAMSNPSCTSTNVAATTNLAGYVNHANCSLAVIGSAGGAQPSGGISDVEPELSFPAITNAGSFMTVTGVLDIVFGVPVTKNLYQALQIAQFGDTSPCDTNAAPGAYTISDTNPACVPSLTKAQISAIYSQAFTDWDTIVRRSNGATLSSVAPVAPTDTTARICRRVAASGTQAGAEAYFFGQRCVSAAQTFAGPDDASSVNDTTYVPSDFANSLVNANPSSGNVRTCLQAAQTGGFWGIGVLSTEVTSGNLSGAGDSFRFVGIDGYAPTLANTANGNYTYYTSNVLTKSNLATGVPAAIMDRLPVILANPAVLANLNATFAGRPWGNGGILAKQGATTSNTAPYSDAEMTSSPVNALTRGGNNCVPGWAPSPTPTL